MISQGITHRTAATLAGEYSEALIREKIELLDYLHETQSPLVTKNPAGYLRRAIEEDYKPPKGFKTRAQREAEAREGEKAQGRAERVRKAHREKTDRRGQALKKYGTSERLIPLWREAQQSLQARVTKATYETYLKNAALLSFNDSVAVLGVSNQFAQEWIEGQLAKIVTRVLEDILKEPLELRVEVY